MKISKVPPLKQVMGPFHHTVPGRALGGGGGEADETALVVRQGLTGFAHHRRLGAAASNPAGHDAVEGDDGAVAGFAGGGLFGPHDGGGGKGHALTSEVTGVLEVVVKHGGRVPGFTR